MLMDVQSYVAAMCESIDVMKVTGRQREFIKAAFRASIEYANAKHGMYASKNAKDAVGSAKISMVSSLIE